MATKAGGVLKTSTVMIISNGERLIYKSVRDVPDPWRKRLLESTQGENSGTILIADEAGRERLERDEIWPGLRECTDEAFARPEVVPDPEQVLGQEEFPQGDLPSEDKDRRWIVWAGFPSVALVFGLIWWVATRHW